jgi:hypothetical protein
MLGHAALGRPTIRRCRGSFQEQYGCRYDVRRRIAICRGGAIARGIRGWREYRMPAKLLPYDQTAGAHEQSEETYGTYVRAAHRNSSLMCEDRLFMIRSARPVPR